jgi:hypothetical protein
MKAAIMVIAGVEQATPVDKPKNLTDLVSL